MSDLEDLFRVCLEKPDEDTPRLMLADELDSSDMPELAELCRVQVGLARMPQSYVRCRLCEGHGYRDMPPHHRPCKACDSTCVVEHAIYLRQAAIKRREAELLADEAKLRRGVLRETRTKADVIHCRRVNAVAGGCCDRHADMKACNCLEDAIGISWHRGLPTVECTLAKCGEEVEMICGRCKGKGGFRGLQCIVCKTAILKDDNKSYVRIWQPSAFAIAAMRESGCSLRVTGVDDCICRIEPGGVCHWRDSLVFFNQPFIPASICPKGEYATNDAARAALDAVVNQLTFRATWPQLAEVT